MIASAVGEACDYYTYMHIHGTCRGRGLRLLYIHAHSWHLPWARPAITIHTCTYMAPAVGEACDYYTYMHIHGTCRGRGLQLLYIHAHSWHLPWARPAITIHTCTYMAPAVGEACDHAGDKRVDKECEGKRDAT